MDDQIFIQHRFTIIDPDTGCSFSDAIVLPQSQYEALSPQDIATIKQERFTNWQTTISTPPPLDVDTIDEQIQGTVDLITNTQLNLQSLNQQSIDLGGDGITSDQADTLAVVADTVNSLVDTATLANADIIAQPLDTQQLEDN